MTAFLKLSLALILLIANTAAMASADFFHAGSQEPGGLELTDSSLISCKTGIQADSLELKTQEYEHDHCIHNHCDTSSGSQVSADKLRSGDIIKNRCIYAVDNGSWIPDPKLPLLLRPPLAVS